MDLQEIVDRIDARLKDLGLSAAKASKDAGLSADAIRNMKRAIKDNGHKGVSLTTLAALAPVLGTTAAWLAEGAPAEPQNAIVGDRLPSGGSKIPLYGHAVAGEDGEFPLNGNKLDDIMAPPSLAAARGAYAVTVASDSMEPRYFDGETVFVDPGKRVSRGDFVVAQISHHDGVETTPLAYIKRFVRHNSKELVLEQYNPPKELRFEHERVVSVHYIVMGGRAT